MDKPLLLGADLSALPAQGLAVVGFSGGADSTALAHWLAGEIGTQRLLLAHVNHGLRGAESDREEEMARSFAQGMGLRFALLRADAAAEAEKRSMGLEECGRLLRYAFFESLAPGEDDRILTAHNADDNAETILFHLIRGTGLSGLCGIPPVRGKILRPFLGVSRAQTEAYCQEQGLSFSHDSSNDSRDYSRNRLRLDVLPVLRDINPRAVQAMGRAAALLGEDRLLLEELSLSLLHRAQRPGGLDIPTLKAAPAPLRKRAIFSWLAAEGGPMPEEKHLALIEEMLAGHGAVPLPGKRILRRRRGLLYLEDGRK